MLTSFKMQPMHMFSKQVSPSSRGFLSQLQRFTLFNAGMV